MRKVAGYGERAAIARADCRSRCAGARPQPGPGGAGHSGRWGALRCFRPREPAGECSQPIEERLLLTESEAADFLRLSPVTLSHYRYTGDGPAYCKLGGAIRYYRADILPGHGRNAGGTPERERDRLAPCRRYPQPRPCPPVAPPEEEGERGFVTTLTDDIRAKVSAFSSAPACPTKQFGKLALGRPQFVENLAGQQTMTLKTADRLLQFLGEAPIAPSSDARSKPFLTSPPSSRSGWAPRPPAIPGSLAHSRKERSGSLRGTGASLDGRDRNAFPACRHRQDAGGQRQHDIQRRRKHLHAGREARENGLSGVRHGQGCPRPCSRG